MHISFCIITYGNNLSYVRNAVRSIHEYANDLNYEIIIIDNNSTDLTFQKIKKEFPTVRILRNEVNIGYAPGMNMAIKNSTGKYIMCMSMDAELLDGSVQSLIAFMEKNPKCGLAGPRMVNHDNEVLTSMHHPNMLLSVWAEIVPLKSWLRKSRFIRKILTNLIPNSSGLTSDYYTTQMVDVLSGGILLTTRKFIDEAGYLDENFPLGPDDYDLCLRSKQNGYQNWFVAESQMIHGQKPKENVFSLNPVYLYIRLPALLYFHSKHNNKISFMVFKWSILLLLLKWKVQISRKLGRNSKEYRILLKSEELCSKVENYKSMIRKGWYSEFQKIMVSF